MRAARACLRLLCACLGLGLLAGLLGVLPLWPGPAPTMSAAAAVTPAGDEPAPADPQVTLRQLFTPDGGLARSGKRDASMVLADLYLARIREASASGAPVLPRPSDGRADPEGMGYTADQVRTCGRRICVHYVRTTDDAPDLTDADGDKVPDWVSTTLRVMERVWRAETGRLGYRPPPADAGRGGDDKFDVYLADIGELGLYGYCAPEDGLPAQPQRARSYCVLDNDMAEFPGRPIDSLKVTAAHEFFHAVQFGYDVGEDRWLMEASATWMEEQVFDGINDNRQFLGSGQLEFPWVPLDTYEWGGFGHYGNWLFLERLAADFGPGVVKELWQGAAAQGKRNAYSTRALRRVLKRHGTDVGDYLARFALTNRLPGRFYPEGKHYDPAPVTRRFQLAPGAKQRHVQRVEQLATGTVQVTPKRGRARLRLKVDAPRHKAHPAVKVLVQRRNGKLSMQRVRLSHDGKGRIVVPFSARKVERVLVAVANGAVGYSCDVGSNRSCQGDPKHPDYGVELRFKVRRR